MNKVEKNGIPIPPTVVFVDPFNRIKEIRPELVGLKHTDLN